MHNDSKQFNASQLDFDGRIPGVQGTGTEPTIGEIIARANNLTPEQIEEVINYQREHSVRFGEAAVALGYANADDVMWALAQQFHYPYSNDSANTLSDELVVARRPFSTQAESFRSIRSHLIMKLYSGEGSRRALAIVSPDAGDGRSYFAANIAAAFSQLSGRTLLIDADFRTPRQHEIFNLKSTGAGLSGILSGRAMSKVIQSVKALPNLFVLPVGAVPPNPLELVERPAFEILIRELLTKFDRVIVDTPAASRGMDCAVIAAKCGAALMVARQDVTRVNALQDMSATLRISDTRVVGSVLNAY